MKVSEAKFTRRYNVGQYEHEEYSLVAVVEDDDTAAEVLAQLKTDVQTAYAGAEASTTDSDKDEEDEEDTATKPSKGKKGKGKKSNTDESEDEETGGDDTDEDDSETDTEEDEDQDEEQEAPSKKDKKFKKKPQVYERSNETHKELFSGVLKAVAPDWKKSEQSKAKAKKVSIKLEGEEFLDVDGEVLPSFKAAVKKGMAK